MDLDLFQSTAHPKAGRIDGWRWTRRASSRFNPRPTRRQAESAQIGADLPAVAQFQSTAHPKAGRITDVLASLARHAVSIHGPPEGRPNPGRRGRQAANRSFNPRPTRRQAESAGSRSKRAKRKFQSTAHPKAGRIDSASAPAGGNSGFNPRPTRRQAESACPQALLQCDHVSIHGPPEGRPNHRI